MTDGGNCVGIADENSLPSIAGQLRNSSNRANPRIVKYFPTPTADLAIPRKHNDRRHRITQNMNPLVDEVHGEYGLRSMEDVRKDVIENYVSQLQYTAYYEALNLVGIRIRRE